MIILQMFLITLLILFLGSLIPIIQMFIIRKKNKVSYKYTFSDELVNFDFDLESDNRCISRAILANRGWIRGPQGNIMTDKDFEKKKEEEYKIQLP